MLYSNPEVDELIIAAQGSLDDKEQHELLGEALKIILQDLPICPVIDRIYPWGLREDLMDVTIDHAAIGVYLYDAWIMPSP
jgi:ABC-type transport system substrate-binding protein